MVHPQISDSVQGEAVAPALGPLLVSVYTEIARRPTDLSALKAELECLLGYLASPEGRTNANCWAADLFFCLDDGWETDWEHLPDAFTDILGDMGGALHDTVQAPDVAANFDSTPEQLLARVRAVEIA